MGNTFPREKEGPKNFMDTNIISNIYACIPSYLEVTFKIMQRIIGVTISQSKRQL